MAASPDLKLFDPRGQYVAALKHAEDAAAVLAVYGEGAKLRLGHSGPYVWIEGKESQPAAESYDFVATTVYARIAEHRRAFDVKHFGRELTELADKRTPRAKVQS